MNWKSCKDSLSNRVYSEYCRTEIVSFYTECYVYQGLNTNVTTNIEFPHNLLRKIDLRKDNHDHSGKWYSYAGWDVEVDYNIYSKIRGDLTVSIIEAALVELEKRLELERMLSLDWTIRNDCLTKNTENFTLLVKDSCGKNGFNAGSRVYRQYQIQIIEAGRDSYSHYYLPQFYTMTSTDQVKVDKRIEQARLQALSESDKVVLEIVDSIRFTIDKLKEHLEMLNDRRA